MCLFPKLIRNPKYRPNKKNGGNVPTPKDERLLYVPVGCGKCYECRRQKAHAWQTRLIQELMRGTKGYFVTLTFNNENLDKLEKELKQCECNAVAGLAVRRFLERWRKVHKKSLRHWLITELGHNGTERIHLHGIIFTDKEFNNEILQKYWQYGLTYTGTFCNDKTINYIVKYVTKIDTDHKGFEGQIFCSSGIGSNWCSSGDFTARQYNGKNTIEYISMPNGRKINMPIYYRNKRYTEQEREDLWLNKMDKQEIYVAGIKCDISNEKGLNEYLTILKSKQEWSRNLGYGDDSEEWKKKEYNTTLRKLNAKSKLQNARKMQKNIT